ncbi:hypothetical protein [Treponema primitia]|uniref:hypothetical protein n=1 Tax=Treponema primitia TaxID=88058 RepID=UPI000255510F|nr:hypothetical protein [Treponema primitia]
MKRNWLIGLSGVLLAVSLVFVSCGGDDGGGGPEIKKTSGDDFATAIEEAFEDLPVEGITAAAVKELTFDQLFEELANQTGLSKDEIKKYFTQDVDGTNPVDGSIKIKDAGDFYISEALWDDLSGKDETGPGSGSISVTKVQVYDAQDTTKAITGKATVKLDPYLGDRPSNPTYLNAGTIANGKLTLTLPSTGFEDFLFTQKDEPELKDLTIQPADTKILWSARLRLFNAAGNEIGRLRYEKASQSDDGEISYWYFDKDVRITGTLSSSEEHDNGITWTGTDKYDINVKKGWNPIRYYGTGNQTTHTWDYTCTSTIGNTSGYKWTLDWWGDGLDPDSSESGGGAQAVVIDEPVYQYPKNESNLTTTLKYYHGMADRTIRTLASAGIPDFVVTNGHLNVTLPATLSADAVYDTDSGLAGSGLTIAPSDAKIFFLNALYDNSDGSGESLLHWGKIGDNGDANYFIYANKDVTVTRGSEVIQLKAGWNWDDSDTYNWTYYNWDNED